MPNLTQDTVRDLFTYDPLTGNLLWKNPTSTRTPAGTIAGHTRWDCVQVICIGAKKYLAHRLVWLLHYGSWPTKHIQHVNWDNSDNRIENLVEADPYQRKNMKLHRNNTSGFQNVQRHGDKWRVRITDNEQKYICLGTYDDPEEAHKARDSYLRDHPELGYKL